MPAELLAVLGTCSLICMEGYNMEVQMGKQRTGAETNYFFFSSHSHVFCNLESHKI